MAACPAGGERGLTAGERALVAENFGTAIALDPVRIRRRKWFPLQPRRVTMAPMGHLHFHPKSPSYCDDFAAAGIEAQAHFVHEMVHVWQAQTMGRFYLPLMRHPFARYSYRLVPGRPFRRYGLEQQAEIVADRFRARRGAPREGAPPLAELEALVPFGG